MAKLSSIGTAATAGTPVPGGGATAVTTIAGATGECRPADVDRIGEDPDGGGIGAHVDDVGGVSPSKLTAAEAERIGEAFEKDWAAAEESRRRHVEALRQESDDLMRRGIDAVGTAD